MNTTEVSKEKPPVRPVLRELLVYEKISFPLDRVVTIRATIQGLQDAFGYKYKTQKNGNMIDVIRIK